MTVYRTELDGLCFNPRVTNYTAEANACTAIASAIAQLATPFTDGSWIIDLDGRLIGFTDYPPAEDVLLANQESGL